MNRRVYKILCFIFLLNFIFCVKTNAQDTHFIFIQSDNSQVFNAEINGKDYTSSSIGYLIISNLQDGPYQMIITFPQNVFPKQNFNFTINKKDIGFQLKDFGSKGWGLFNTQSLEVIMPGSAQQNVTDTSKSSVKNTNAFGEMLGDVVNDSTLNKPNINEPTTVTNNTLNNLQPQTTTPSNVDAASVLASTDLNNLNANTSSTNTKGIIKASQTTTDEGTNVMFIDFDNDKDNDKNDTINIFIPAISEVSSNLVSQTTQSTDTQNNVSNVSNVSNNDINNPFYKSSQPAATVVNNNVLIKVDCLKMATDADLEKARKKMIKETGANEMVLDAKKILSGKCVTTAQVKTMGNLFLSDDARYNFYEAMYNFTYDYGNYPSLENQLIDEYYKKRFRALLH